MSTICCTRSMRVAVRGLAVAQRLDVARVVAAHRQHVLDAEVAQLDQRVLGLLAREAVAQDVRHGVDVVLVLDQRADAERARPLALDLALDRALVLLVHHLGGVAGDVDERRMERHQVVDQLEQAAQRAAALRRDDLVRDQGPRGPRQVLDDLHSSCWRYTRPSSTEPSREPRRRLEAANHNAANHGFMTLMGSLPRGFRVVRLAGDVLVGPIAFLLAFLVRLYVPVPMTRSLLPFDRISFYAEHWIPVVVTQVAVLYFFAFYDPPQPASRPELLRRLVAATCLQGLVLMGYYFLERRSLPALGAAPLRSAQLPAALRLAAPAVATAAAATPARRDRRRRTGRGGAGGRACATRPGTGSSWWASSRRPESRPGALAPMLGTVDDVPRLVASGRIEDVILASESSPWQTRLIDSLAKSDQPSSNVWLLPGPVREPDRGHPLLVGRRSSADRGGARSRLAHQLAAQAVVRRRRSAGCCCCSSRRSCSSAPSASLIGSGRPIFYRQVRVGRGGQPFTIVKLRTMRAGAEDSTGEALATSTDPRVTGVGRWLRRHRIDEIPQLWNVLAGSMSLVGPRPERPGFADAFSSDVAGYSQRYVVPTGRDRSGAGARRLSLVARDQGPLRPRLHRQLELVARLHDPDAHGQGRADLSER